MLPTLVPKKKEKKETEILSWKGPIKTLESSVALFPLKFVSTDAKKSSGEAPVSGI